MPNRESAAPALNCKHQWQLIPCQDANKLPLDRAGHSCTVVGSKLYVVAGRKGSLFYSDVLVLDTQTRRWSQNIRSFPFTARANHTATLINNNQIWFIAGSDCENVLGDVFVLDLTTSSWHAVAINNPLLQRTAHAAEVHPRLPHCILVMGGYAPVPDAQPHQQQFHMTNDLLLLHTDTRQVEQLFIFNSIPPTPRAYHSMNIIGDKAYIFGGRNLSAVITDESLLAVYDVVQNAWSYPGNVSGSGPSPRSSHRAVVHDGRIVMYGGAGESAAGKERMNDVHSLVLLSGGQRLCWSDCDSPDLTREDTLQGRSAHTMSLVGDVLYVLCGYAGVSCNKYAGDCWSLRLRPDAFNMRSAEPGAGGAGGGRPASVLREQQQQQQQQQQQPTSTGPRNGAAAAAASGGGGGNTKNVTGAAGGAAEAGSGWRVVKRQRSGGSAPAQQQQQQQCQHLQPQAPPQQPPQQSPKPQHEALAAAAASAAAAAVLHAAGSGHGLSGVGVGGLAPGMSCPASPNTYHNEFLKQELDHLRELYQQQCSITSSLEGQNRLLKQQLADAKQEWRSDKQQMEQQLQQLQGEALRHKLAADATLVQKQREQEHSITLQQQLEVLSSKCNKLEHDNEQLRLKVLSLQTSARQQDAALADRDKERQQLADALQQQQDKQRRLEEQLDLDRQQQVELRRHSDYVSEEKRKHEAALTQARVDALAKDATLQEATNKLRDMQQQLESSRQTSAEQAKQAEMYMKMQQDIRHELQAVQNSVKALQGDKARLEDEMKKLKQEIDAGKAELSKAQQREQGAKAALMQIQGGYTAALNALNGR